jgi:hypothetical protein
VFQVLFTVQAEKRAFPASFLSQKVLKSLETSLEVPGCALFRVELALVAFLFFG